MILRIGATLIKEIDRSIVIVIDAILAECFWHTFSIEENAATKIRTIHRSIAIVIHSIEAFSILIFVLIGDAETPQIAGVISIPITIVIALITTGIVWE